jgi:hypothetical protein
LKISVAFNLLEYIKQRVLILEHFIHIVSVFCLSVVLIFLYLFPDGIEILLNQFVKIC